MPSDPSVPSSADLGAVPKKPPPTLASAREARAKASVEAPPGLGTPQGPPPKPDRPCPKPRPVQPKARPVQRSTKIPQDFQCSPLVSPVVSPRGSGDVLHPVDPPELPVEVPTLGSLGGEDPLGSLVRGLMADMMDTASPVVVSGEVEEPIQPDVASPPDETRPPEASPSEEASPPGPPAAKPPPPGFPGGAKAPAPKSPFLEPEPEQMDL